MPPRSQPQPFDPAATSSSGIGRNLGLLSDIAQTFRRIKADEEFDAKGVRTIWHRGTMRTEMSSWESQSETIVKQELSFFGLVVEFTHPTRLRTGWEQPDDHEAAGAGKATGRLLLMDTDLSPKTLDYASHLLRNAPERDYYMQHLLKEVNVAIAKLGVDESRTIVSGIGAFSRSRAADLFADDTASMSRPRVTANAPSRSILVALAILGLLVGLCLGALLI